MAGVGRRAGAKPQRSAATDRRPIERSWQPVDLPSERPLARLVGSSADLEQAGVALVAPARPAAMLEPTAQLFVADHRQHRPQVLVVSNGPLVDLANLVEGPVGEFDSVMADRKSAVTYLPIAALAGSLGSTMKITLSYCNVSAWESRRCSFQAKASSRSSPARSGRCRSFLFAGGLAKHAL
jgi:hypothetical protein